jgi:hypothetical protein
MMKCPTPLLPLPIALTIPLKKNELAVMHKAHRPFLNPQSLLHLQPLKCLLQPRRRIKAIPFLVIFFIAETQKNLKGNHLLSFNPALLANIKLAF